MGYSLEATISDIIDNSITAQATTITIKFFPVGQPYILILDDGAGMTGNELNIAMQYGSKNPNKKREPNDLGRFGLGLKTASLSQSRTLKVISLKNGELSGRRWDMDFILQTGEWSLAKQIVFTICSRSSGVFMS
ncbi:MAG: ATP-binding protein [Clostridium sp.]|uniref:ATP-binding protein n=1 Tax=Clostridium sp. TaxID=1506 RepID=UPI003D6D69E6